MTARFAEHAYMDPRLSAAGYGCDISFYTVPGMDAAVLYYRRDDPGDVIILGPTGSYHAVAGPGLFHPSRASVVRSVSIDRVRPEGRALFGGSLVLNSHDYVKERWPLPGRVSLFWAALLDPPTDATAEAIAHLSRMFTPARRRAPTRLTASASCTLRGRAGLIVWSDDDGVPYGVSMSASEFGTNIERAPAARVWRNPASGTIVHIYRPAWLRMAITNSLFSAGALAL